MSCFVIDAFARRIVGGTVSSSLRTDLALDALAPALYARVVDPRDALVHHRGHGSQSLSIRDTERLAEAGIEPSVGRVGDSHDHVLAESIIGRYKAEVIRPHGPWRGLRRWSLQRSTGPTGSTTGGPSNRSRAGLRPRPTRRTIAKASTRRWPRVSHNTVSGKTGAVHLAETCRARPRARCSPPAPAPRSWCVGIADAVLGSVTGSMFPIYA